ncbi:hypothetical protein TNCT_598531 [Trichonephila clavata]|uniref:Uncharacterized protein n=1 Tax=Trichonephila clavata TaxID=2740835 RepID=A0A8X6FGW2_TRICU|nr:hypothetical protein TNCT_598531 [Trichonephila clavata]
MHLKDGPHSKNPGWRRGLWARKSDTADCLGNPNIAILVPPRRLFDMWRRGWVDYACTLPKVWYPDFFVEEAGCDVRFLIREELLLALAW